SDVLAGRSSMDWYEVPPPVLSWHDLPAVRASGLVDVQAHSRTHPNLTKLDPAGLLDEVARAKAELERGLGYALTSFSYPAGIYGEREVRAVLDAGFRAGVTTMPGVNAGGPGLGELRRTMLRWGDGRQEFAAKLEGLLDLPSRLSL